MSRVTDPFLGLDELQRERDQRLASGQADAARQFGQSILNYQTLSQQREDRANRMARERRQDALAARREQREEDDAQRKADEADEKSSEKLLADAATARTATNESRAYTPPQTLPTIPDPYTLPAKAQAPLSLDNAPDYSSLALPRDYAPPGAGNAPSAPGPARVASDTDLVNDIRGLPGLEDRTPEQVQAAMETARTKRATADAGLELKREQAARVAAQKTYQDALLAGLPEKEALAEAHQELERQRIGVSYAQLAQRQTEEAGKAARHDQDYGLRERGQALKEQGHMSPDGLKNFTRYDQELSDIDNVQKELDAGAGHLTGPLRGRVTEFMQGLRVLDPASATFAADLKTLANEKIHAFAGSAMTATELAQIAPTLGSLRDPEDVLRALLEHRAALAKRHMASIVDVEEANGPVGNTIRPRFESRGRQPAPAPSANGRMVKVQYKGKTKLFTPDRAAEMVKKLPGAQVVP